MCVRWRHRWIVCDDETGAVVTSILLEIRGTAEGGEQGGGDMQLHTPWRWFRLAVYSDPPPRMSHIGFWRTRAGHLRGLNLRFKLRGRYITCLAHTHLT